MRVCSYTGMSTLDVTISSEFEQRRCAELRDEASTIGQTYLELKRVALLCVMWKVCLVRVFALPLCCGEDGDCHVYLVRAHGKRNVLNSLLHYSRAFKRSVSVAARE
jgi:hypothetical protein